MFILNEKKFNEFDTKKAEQFVKFWNGYYKDDVSLLEDSKKKKDDRRPINYLEELNLGNPLTDQNIKRLLRWKDPLRLTDPIKFGQKDERRNEKVTGVTDQKGSINKFRKLGKKEKSAFKTKAEKIFPSGPIWGTFLFHIARPFEYPIADQNVFRAFLKHKPKKKSFFKVEDNVKKIEWKDWKGYWEGYKEYTEYFFEVAISAGKISEKPKGDEDDIKSIVGELKKVDNALFMFGKFLNQYDKQNQSIKPS